ncbi:phosphatidylethanolamine N-methyltransferase [Phlegmacium glaucopus]|nr:phosphatidylethanolamine N-methyltransferase [Phlegmacium glaucopus]
MKPTDGFLRQRKASTSTAVVAESVRNVVEDPQDDRECREEVVWGKTPGGEVFRVPTTHDVLTTLFHPGYQKSHLDLLNLALLGLQIVLFILLSPEAAQIFFLFYFAFWRVAYDGGLGWVLTKQSKKKWIVKEVQKLGWLDEERRPAVRKWIRKQLADKMGKDYSFDDLPLEYNTWLLFRQAVDVILVNDFLSYCMFAFSCFRVPGRLSIAVHVMRWLGGIALISFNLWVKTEAHNVVKDYGWYWGDVFFQRGALVFDGVFELAPHPMYSVGYAGYYGLSLISGSYAVLFVSLAAHAAQFAFLVFFENPHIERMYGKRKVIAKRTPLFPSVSNKKDDGPVESSTTPPTASNLPLQSDCYMSMSTPAATEGDTATDTELDTETEIEELVPTTTKANHFSNLNLSKVSRHLSIESTTSSGRGTPIDTSVWPRTTKVGTPQSRKVLSQHDLFNKYFRRDTVVLRNVDLLRASDVMLVLIIFYGLALSLLPTLSRAGSLVLHFTHALAWCIIHYFGLGLLLRAQSESKFLVRHYLKNYHYSTDDARQSAIVEAFENWKIIYNLSMCMTYVSCIGIVWESYLTPHDWAVGNDLLCHTLGALLIGLHIWATMESYEVLGLFGWFFGDFFMEEFPAHLEYTGIYRYLNNPEAMGGAAYFGLALISGSKLVLSLAVIRHLANWWFLSSVEHPHMRKLYGDSLRKDAGFVKVMKSVASKNARIFKSRAGRHAPELKRVAREVIGTFDKVYEETADAVEEFLARSAPKFSEVVQDTKVLLQQSRERLVITRVANDISSYDTSKYRVSIVPSSSTGRLSFHLGEPITVKWQAPHKHSRKDWIGLYRVGANKSRQVTKTSSLGMWLPVYDEEWDGDVPLGLNRAPSPHRDAEMGTATFKANKLPWLVGRYEVRYHHDGKYNVMSMDGPIEIYVDKPSEVNLVSVRESLMRIVPLCLDSDPSLIPLSCKIPKTPLQNGSRPLPTSEAPPEPTNIEIDHEYRDPDDFSFWSEQQAKRISAAIKQIFDVEYAPEVIVADANLMALANRILVSKEILSFGPGAAIA